MGAVFRVILTLAFSMAFCVVTCSHALAEPANGSPHHQEYIRLRNLDSSGDGALYEKKWVNLGSRFWEEFSRGAGTLSARTLLFAADTHYRVWRHSGDRGILARAEMILDALIRSSGSVFQPEYRDALVLRGDIALSIGASAEEWYRRAVGLDASFKGLGRQRLQSLANGTFRGYTPSPDLEIPRLVRRRSAGFSGGLKRLVIDPGHGGYDGGAEGVSGLFEKDLVLDIAYRVKAELEERYPVSVLLTRTDDSFVALARRTNYANRRQADAFISLHMNASPAHRLHGLEAYYLDTTDDEASRLLAERENGIPSGAEVSDLSFILSDLIQSGKIEESIELTHHIEQGVYDASAQKHPALKRYGVKKGPFYVLVALICRAR